MECLQQISKFCEINNLKYWTPNDVSMTSNGICLCCRGAVKFKKNDKRSIYLVGPIYGGNVIRMIHSKCLKNCNNIRILFMKELNFENISIIKSGKNNISVSNGGIIYISVNNEIHKVNICRTINNIVCLEAKNIKIVKGETTIFTFYIDNSRFCIECEFNGNYGLNTAVKFNHEKITMTFYLAKGGENIYFLKFIEINDASLEISDSESLKISGQISFRIPYGHLLVNGHKTIENRKKPLPKKYWNKTLAVQSSKTWDSKTDKAIDHVWKEVSEVRHKFGDVSKYRTHLQKERQNIIGLIQFSPGDSDDDDKAFDPKLFDKVWTNYPKETKYHWLSVGTKAFKIEDYIHSPGQVSILTIKPSIMEKLVRLTSQKKNIEKLSIIIEKFLKLLLFLLN